MAELEVVMIIANIRAIRLQQRVTGVSGREMVRAVFRSFFCQPSDIRVAKLVKSFGFIICQTSLLGLKSQYLATAAKEQFRQPQRFQK